MGAGFVREIRRLYAFCLLIVGFYLTLVVLFVVGIGLLVLELVTTGAKSREISGSVKWLPGRFYKITNVKTALQIIALLTVFSFLGCKDATLQQYRNIVNQADRFEVVFISISKTISIPAGEIESFKDVITSGIKPEMQRVFIGDTRVDFFRRNQRIGYLMVSKGSIANFNSDGLNFGFHLTYRMGMWIGNIIDASRR